MEADPIVVSDIGRDFFARCSHIFVDVHCEFSFDGSNTAFHERIVIAVIGATHALVDLPSRQ